MVKVKGGAHLGAVRNWMQWNCPYGETVNWGSTDDLGKRITPRDLDEIAQIVADAVNQETKQFLSRLVDTLERAKSNAFKDESDTYLKIGIVLQDIQRFIGE